MTLKEALKENEGQIIKVGTSDDSAFIYCGNCDDKASEKLMAYEEREVIEIYPSFYGGNIIIFKGDESGKFWEVEEYEGKKPKQLTTDNADFDSCLSLVHAIYEDAADDLMWGLVCGNKRLVETSENFLTSGSYGFDPNIGAAIIDKARAEVKIAKKFVEDFNESLVDKIEIPKKEVSDKVVKFIIKETKSLKFRTEKGKEFIIKKKERRYEGTEWCCECNQEFDFIFYPERGSTVKCPHCGAVQHPCSLCSDCDGKCEENLQSVGG